MKIGVVSDTHDRIDTFSYIAKTLKEEDVAMVVHLGDWVAPFAVANFVQAINSQLPGVPIKGIFGNNDGDHFNIMEKMKALNLPLILAKEIHAFEIEKRRIVLYHGSEERIADALLKCGEYDVVMRGHNHIAKIENVNNVLHLNPGTASFVVDGKSVDTATFATYDTVTNEAKLITFTAASL